MNVKKPGALFVLFMLVLCGVLVWFFITLEDYYDYTSDAVEGAASATPLDRDNLALLASRPGEKFNTEIKYRNFFLTAPGAKTVELQADFNQWGKNKIELKAYSRGYFEISVALAAGEYKYVFVVDGKDVLDPTNKDRTEENGRAVCIKTVR